MMMSLLAGSAPLTSSPHAKGEADPALKSSTPGNPKPDAQSTTSTSVQPEQGKPADFAALLAAVWPQSGQQGLAGKAQTLPVKPPDTALENFTADLNALVSSLTEKPDASDLSGMVTAFVGLLQNYDAAKGGNATAVLVENLKALDTADLAVLDAASLDPAILFASLAALAEIPMVESSGMLVPSGHVPQLLRSAAETAFPARDTSLKGRDSADSLQRPHVAQPLAAVDSVKPVQQQLSGSGEGRVDLRTVVMTALATPGAGAEPDAVALASAQSETRTAFSAPTDIARAAEAPPPPASGFARNLAQQIRQAQFTDGHTRITLAPRGLGEIEIEMRPDEAGKLRIVLRAENPAVLHALRGDRDGLLLTLTESGADVRDADLSFEDFSHRQRRNAEASDAPTGGIAQAIGPDTPDVTVPRPGITAAGTVDMLT